MMTFWQFLRNVRCRISISVDSFACAVSILLISRWCCEASWQRQRINKEPGGENTGFPKRRRVEGGLWILQQYYSVPWCDSAKTAQTELIQVHTFYSISAGPTEDHKKGGSTVDAQHPEVHPGQ